MIEALISIREEIREVETGKVRGRRPPTHDPSFAPSAALLPLFRRAVRWADGDLIRGGQADKTNNLLKNAPHTMEEVSSASWSHPYTRDRAVYPVPGCAPPPSHVVPCLFSAALSAPAFCESSWRGL